MSEYGDYDKYLDAANQYAEEFGLTDETDPLAKYEERCKNLPDAFDTFMGMVLIPNDPAARTIDEYERAFTHWRQFMETQDRHPACPSDQHVRRFIQWLREGGASGKPNSNRTIKFKLQKIQRAYRFWCNEGRFPHSQNYRPFETARDGFDLTVDPTPDPPRLTVEELGSYLKEVKDVRDRAMMLCQVKLFMRAGAVANAKIADLHIDNTELQKHYPEMGTSDEKLADRPDSFYIPTRHEREGNKSYVPRTIPIDDELKRALIRYLLIRPEHPDGWLFLSYSFNDKLGRGDPNRPWRKLFADYDVPAKNREIRSHYGRHFATTYWKIEENLPVEYVHYMRGDRVNDEETKTDAINDYLHVYFEDIEEVYKRRVFKFGL